MHLLAHRDKTWPLRCAPSSSLEGKIKKRNGCLSIECSLVHSTSLRFISRRVAKFLSQADLCLRSTWKGVPTWPRLLPWASVPVSAWLGLILTYQISLLVHSAVYPRLNTRYNNLWLWLAVPWSIVRKRTVPHVRTSGFIGGLFLRWWSVWKQLIFRVYRLDQRIGESYTVFHGRAFSARAIGELIFHVIRYVDLWRVDGQNNANCQSGCAV